MEKENEFVADSTQVVTFEPPFMNCPIHGKQTTLSFHSGTGGVDTEWNREWCFACVAQILNDQVSMLLWKHEQEQGKKEGEE